MSLVEQLYAFGMTIVAGVVMGVVFDLFRVLRGSARPRSVLTWVSDILYWVSVTPLVAGLLLHANWGELRFYVVLGIGLGLALYFTLCSPFVLEALFFITRTVGFIVSWTAHAVLSVVTWPIMLFRNIGYALSSLVFHRVGRNGAARGRSALRGSFLRPSWRPPLAWRRR